MTIFTAEVSYPQENFPDFDIPIAALAGDFQGKFLHSGLGLGWRDLAYSFESEEKCKLFVVGCRLIKGLSRIAYKKGSDLGEDHDTPGGGRGSGPWDLGDEDEF